MKLADLARLAGCLIRDTFRQSMAYGIFWILLGITLVSVVVCLGMHVEGAVSLAAPGENPDFLPRNDVDAHDAAKLKQSGVSVARGHLSLAFGAIQIPIARDVRAAVHFLQLVLAGGIADTLGVLLTLVWTAGFLPGFLEERSITVILARPTPRWALLTAKYVGVLAFVLVHATLFVGGTWLAIGLRTGVWDTSYGWAIPLLLLHFAVFFSFSLLLAVWTRNTVACVFGSIAFWMLAWGTNYGHFALAQASSSLPDGLYSSRLMWLSSASYWTLPKPLDLGLLLHHVLGAEHDFHTIFDWHALQSLGLSFPLSVLTSLAFAACVLTAATRKFCTQDY